MLKMAQLTPRDKAILNCVFNPSLPLTEAYNEELDSSLIGNLQSTAALTTLLQIF